ncbi:MAG: DUF3034 family protein [Thalassotalea sp.]
MNNKLLQRYLAAITLSVIFISPASLAGSGKLIATSGISQIEGSGGGGIVPWATIAGYGSQDEISASAFYSQASLDDYRLHVVGANVGLYDRVELSVAKQTFDLTTLGGEIEQTIYGAKVKLYGDVIYSTWPQISVGLQHKKLNDGTIANALGARDSSSSTDYYLAATKVNLGFAFGFNTVWNITGRFSQGNELGLLGFASDTEKEHQLLLEASAGILLSRNWVVGLEYREKPDNLGLKEDDWLDAFVAYVPNKDFSLTMAWAKLGTIAGAKNQDGLFFTMTGKLW